VPGLYKYRPRTFYLIVRLILLLFNPIRKSPNNTKSMSFYVSNVYC
jgi:hypothetical protein